MRKSIWSYLVAVLVVIAVPLSAMPRADVASYAKDFRVTVDEAARRLALQPAIGELEARLAAEESATFGGLWLEHEPKFRVVVRFTDPAASARLTARLAGGPLAGVVEVRSARVSLAELETQQKALRAAGNKAGARFESEIDVQSNRMSVFTPDPAKLRTLVGDALPAGTNLERVDRLSRVQNLVGGHALSDCTAGFTVRHNSTGELGVLTAGHCSNYQYYNGIYLPLRTAKDSQSTDAQWHSTCDIVEVSNQVVTPDGGRTITATRTRAYQLVGDYVCKYGKETGYSCGTIGSKSYDPGANHDPTFIRVNDYTNGNGDSGAPWFQEHVALGIHRGEDAYGRSIYMAVDYLAPLGVSVLTYNPGNCVVAPRAAFTYSDSFGGINFDGSASYDPNGSIVSYSWDFGDGSYETSSSPYTTHYFDTWTQYYNVTLTVTDNEGATASHTRTVQVCGGPGQMACPY